MGLNISKDKTGEHLAAVKVAKTNLGTARQELKDYKEKAGRILQVGQGQLFCYRLCPVWGTSFHQ